MQRRPADMRGGERRNSRNNSARESLSLDATRTHTDSGPGEEARESGLPTCRCSPRRVRDMRAWCVASPPFMGSAALSERLV